MSGNNIGTRRESSLHRSLKYQYSGTDGITEAQFGSYVCDACTEEGEYIEIQTGSFGPLREKAEELTKKNKLRIIHPIIKTKTISLYSDKNKLLHNRKSPVKGKTWDLFDVLIYAPLLPLLKNLSIELAVVDVIEKRKDDGSGSWRRKGISITDRLLETRHDSVILKKPADYKVFIPYKKNEEFTARELAEKTGIKPDLARKTIYVLVKIGLIKQIGKKGRAFLYKACK